MCCTVHTGSWLGIRIKARGYIREGRYNLVVIENDCRLGLLLTTYLLHSDMVETDWARGASDVVRVDGGMM